MVKLEENYRSTATILEAANALISNNSERIDKLLRPTRGEELISLTRCDDEVAEAEAVVHRLRTMEAANPGSAGDMAVLYHQCPVPCDRGIAGALGDSLHRCWGTALL